MQEEPLSVGYARADITPSESVPLRGFGNTSQRMSRRVLDPLYATCIAFTDAEGETALVFALDLISATSQWVTHFRPAVSSATGIPEDHIFASGTHTHSGPDYDNKEKPSIARWADEVTPFFAEAAVNALKDRRPARMFTAAVQTNGLNFVRRYILEDGSAAGENYGHFDRSPIARHESEPDRSMQLVKFVREEAPDILLANFQVHPVRTGGLTVYDISADLPGAMRSVLEKKLGCRFAYFTGGAGNINPFSRIPDENIWNDHLSHGNAMAQAALSVMQDFKPAKTGKVRTVWNYVQQPVNHTQDHLVQEAIRIWMGFVRSNDPETWARKANEIGLNSVYHAGLVINKSRLPATVKVPLCALSIGDVGFAFAPYEMFDTNGMQIKAGSPFPMTFVLSCSNTANFAYIPSALGAKNGGYSSDMCWFLPGTGEQFADTLIECLKEVYG